MSNIRDKKKTTEIVEVNNITYLKLGVIAARERIIDECTTRGLTLAPPRVLQAAHVVNDELLPPLPNRTIWKDGKWKCLGYMKNKQGGITSMEGSDMRRHHPDVWFACVPAS